MQPANGKLINPPRPIARDLHSAVFLQIRRKPNPIIVLLFIQNIYNLKTFIDVCKVPSSAYSFFICWGYFCYSCNVFGQPFHYFLLASGEIFCHFKACAKTAELPRLLLSLLLSISVQLTPIVMISASKFGQQWLVMKNNQPK